MASTRAHLKPNESTKKSHLYFLNVMLFICQFFVLLFLFAFHLDTYLFIYRHCISHLKYPFFHFILDTCYFFCCCCCCFSKLFFFLSIDVCRFRNIFPILRFPLRDYPIHCIFIAGQSALQLLIKISKQKQKFKKNSTI